MMLLPTDNLTSIPSGLGAWAGPLPTGDNGAPGSHGGHGRHRLWPTEHQGVTAATADTGCGQLSLRPRVSRDSAVFF